MSPPVVRADLGDFIIFTCDSWIPPNWWKLLDTFPVNAKKHGRTSLVIDGVTLKNSGYYICDGRSKNKHRILARGLLIVNSI